MFNVNEEKATKLSYPNKRDNVRSLTVISAYFWQTSSIKQDMMIETISNSIREEELPHLFS